MFREFCCSQVPFRILSPTNSTSFTASSTAASTGALSPIWPSSPPRVSGSQPTSKHSFHFGAFIALAMRSTFIGFMACASTRLPEQHWTVQRFQIGLDDIKRARAALRADTHPPGLWFHIHPAARRRDQNHGYRNRPRARSPGSWHCAMRRTTSTPKRVVTEKNVADAGDQNAWLLRWLEIRGFLFGSGSISSASKKKRWPGWRSRPISRPGSLSSTTQTWLLPS